VTKQETRVKSSPPTLTPDLLPKRTQSKKGTQLTIVGILIVIILILLVVYLFRRV
jgi:hypothetical protein